LSSGRQVLDALLSKGIDAFAVDVERSELSNALVGKCDRVFNILHGTWGEDGRVQGLLDTLGIPYTGTGVLGCALTMDKNLTKIVCQQHGVLTPTWKMVSSADECEAAAHEIGDKNGAMPLIKISTPREFYDFEAKYQEDSTVYDCPCGLASELEKEIQSTALKVFAITRCEMWGRVDFLLDETGNHYLLEVNTAPGMTDHSLVPMAAAATGLDFPPQLIASE